MRELGLEVRIDPVGNIFGLRQGRESAGACAPVMTGSHIDTVRTGGRYDGNLGVLGGLEVVQTLNDAGITTRRPLVVGAFTDEEGARFHPDMAGSLAYVGGMPLEELYATRGIDGKVFKDELARIGYLGDAPMPLYRPHAYVELHIEQGPVLDIEGIVIGAVEDLQGISWTEVLITGQSNHAGTTPMRLRHDAGYCAAAIGTFVRQLVKELGGAQVGTVGSITLHPNLTNVIAARARVTVDLRNTDDAVLVESERRLAEFLQQLGRDEGVRGSPRW
jgi:beta-ureidopropionase / N-carbamoyl-L-amino-acid hydrolase